MAKIIQAIKNIAGSMDWTKFLNMEQVENKNITKNITASLIKAMSHTSKFFVFLFKNFISYCLTNLKKSKNNDNKNNIKY